MKTITFNLKEYNIPQSWEDVTVGMLVKSSELTELLPDAPVIAVLSAYTGIPVKDLKLSNASEVTKILEIMDFVKEEYKPNPTTCFTLDNNEYCCEDDLLNQKFEDFVSVQTAMYNYSDDKVRVLPRLVAILCKRKGETLDDFNLNERAGLMYNLPMTKAKDIEAFFLHSIKAYNSISLLYSTQDIQKELVLHKIKELQDTMNRFKGETGTFSGTRLRIGIYKLQLWWVKSQLEKYFNLQPTNNSKMTWKQTCRKLLSKMLKRKNDA